MNKKLEKMKTNIEKRIKKQTALVACTLIFLCAFASRIIPIQLDNEAQSQFVAGFQLGLLCTLLIVFTCNLLKSRKALKDEKLLKQLYYQENDERICYINQQVGKSSMSILTVIMVIATIITGYFNIIVLYTMIAVTFSQAIIQMALKMYYTNCISGNDMEE